MNNEYATSEVIEIGKAQEMILGAKVPGSPDDGIQPLGNPDNDLDE
jgi:hypothetical protein